MPLRSENQDYAPLKPFVGGEKPSAENGRDTASVSAFKRAPEKTDEVATLLPPGVLGEPKDKGKAEKAAPENEEIAAPVELEPLAPPAVKSEEQPDESHDEARRREKK